MLLPCNNYLDFGNLESLFEFASIGGAISKDI
jgi:hypothetical protein